MKYKKKHLKREYKLLLVIILIGFVVSTLSKSKGYSADAEVITKKLDYTEESVFPDDVYGVSVITDIIDQSEARPMTKRLIKYIVIHETDNFEIGVGARNHATYLKNNNDREASWHYTVDDHEIYHHIPDNEIAFHAGSEDGNTYGIGIELCVNKDGKFNKTFDNAARLVAYLLKSYNLGIEDIKTHHDFTGKECPNKILKSNRLDEFKSKVKEYLK